MWEIIQRYWLDFALTGVSGTLVWVARRAMQQAQKAEADNMAVKLGVQALLRDRIIQAHGHYMDKGYCPIYGRENVTAMYEQYHNLGGNGTVTHIVGELSELPTTPPGDSGDED